MASPAQTLQALQLFAQGRQLNDSGDLRGALRMFARAQALLPTHPEILATFAACAEQARDWSTAATLLQQLQTLRPQSTTQLRLAQSLYQLDRIDEAIALLHFVLAANAASPDALRMLGLMLTRQCRWQEALDAGTRLEAVAPGPVSLDLMLNALYHLGRGAELDALVETAMARCPDDLLVMSVCVQHLAKRHDGARGFAWPQAVRIRYLQGVRDIHQLPPRWWDGKPFDGLLLVSGKQGLGDEIIAANMFTELETLRRDTGQDILVECDPRLLPLFRRSFPALAFTGRADDDTLPAAVGTRDYRLIKALDLAYYFRRQTPLPAQQPWLVADGERVRQLREDYRRRFPQQRLAGISWKSSRAPLGANKSMTLPDLAPLLALPACTWFNLQYGAVDDDLAAARAAGLPDIVREPALDPTRDIDGLVAQIAALDVIVSTSNTTAHLAGAVGARCHLLLPKAQAVFWYWGYDGERTPWYPSIHIHRNAREDDWRELAAQAAAALGSAP